MGTNEALVITRRVQSPDFTLDPSPAVRSLKSQASQQIKANYWKYEMRKQVVLQVPSNYYLNLSMTHPPQ